MAGINPATPKPGLEDEELQRAFKTLVTSTPALTSQNEAFEVTPKLLRQQGGGDNNCTSGKVTGYPFLLTYFAVFQFEIQFGSSRGTIQSISNRERNFEVSKGTKDGRPQRYSL